MYIARRYGLRWRLAYDHGIDAVPHHGRVLASERIRRAADTAGSEGVRDARSAPAPAGADGRLRSASAGGQDRRQAGERDTGCCGPAQELSPVEGRTFFGMQRTNHASETSPSNLDGAFVHPSANGRNPGGYVWSLQPQSGPPSAARSSRPAARMSTVPTTSIQ